MVVASAPFTAISPADTVGHPRRVPAARRRSTLRYWLAAVIAVVGAGAGLTIGLTAYWDGPRQIDTFDGVPIPGTRTVQLDEPGGRVVYYEGDKTQFGDVTIAITDPAGTPMAVDRYEGEMIYDAPDSTQGRALATFDGAEPGVYTVVVSGVDTGRLTIGDSVAAGPSRSPGRAGHRRTLRRRRLRGLAHNLHQALSAHDQMTPRTRLRVRSTTVGAPTPVRTTRTVRRLHDRHRARRNRTKPMTTVATPDAVTFGDVLDGDAESPSSPLMAAVDLSWIPLGAGAVVVRASGKVFEALSALIQRRRACDLYDSALVVMSPKADS